MSASSSSGTHVPPLARTPVGEQLVVVTRSALSPSPADESSGEARAGSAATTTLSSFATSHDTALSPTSSMATPIGQGQRKPLKTEYKASFRPFDQYVYNEITDTFTIQHSDRQLSASRSNHDLASPSRDATAGGPDGAQVPSVTLGAHDATLFETLNGGESASSSQEPWYKEVTRRHEKANEYRFKSEVGHNSPLLNYVRADSPYNSERQITSSGGLDSPASDQYTSCDIRSQHSDQHNESAQEHRYKFTPHDYKRDSLIANMANNNNFAPPKEQASSKTATSTTSASAAPRRALQPAARSITRSTAQSRSRSQSTRRPLTTTSTNHQVSKQAQPTSKSNQTTPTKTALSRTSATSKAPATSASRAPATPRPATVSRISTRPAPTSRGDAKVPPGEPTKRTHISTTVSRLSNRPTNGSGTTSTTSRTTSSSLNSKQPVSQPASRTSAASTARPLPRSTTRTSTGTPATAAGRLPTTGLRAPPNSRGTSSTTSTASTRSKTTAKSSSASSGTTAIKSIKTPKALAAQEASAAAAAAAATAATAAAVAAAGAAAVITSSTEVPSDIKPERDESLVNGSTEPRVDETNKPADIAAEHHDEPLHHQSAEEQNLLFTTAESDGGHMLADELAQAERMASAAAKVIEHEPELDLLVSDSPNTAVPIEEKISSVETKAEALEASSSANPSQQLSTAESTPADLVNGLAGGLISAEDRFDSTEREVSADVDALRSETTSNRPSNDLDDHHESPEQHEQEASYNDEPYSLMPTPAVDPNSEEEDSSKASPEDVEILGTPERYEPPGERQIVEAELSNSNSRLNDQTESHSRDLDEGSDQSELSPVINSSDEKREAVVIEREDAQPVGIPEEVSLAGDKGVAIGENEVENNKPEQSCDPVSVGPSDTEEEHPVDREPEATDTSETGPLEADRVDGEDDDRDVMPNQQIQSEVVGNNLQTDDSDPAKYDPWTVDRLDGDRPDVDDGTDKGEPESTMVGASPSEDRSVETPIGEDEAEPETGKGESEGTDESDELSVKSEKSISPVDSKLIGEQLSEERVNTKKDDGAVGDVRSAANKLHDETMIEDVIPESALNGGGLETQFAASKLDTLGERNDLLTDDQPVAPGGEKAHEELRGESSVDVEQSSETRDSSEKSDTVIDQSEVSPSAKNDQQALPEPETEPETEHGQQGVKSAEHEVVASGSADEIGDSDPEGDNNRLDDSTDHDSDKDGRHKELLMSAADLMHVESRQKEEMARKSELARKNSSPQPAYQAGEVILSPDQLNEHFDKVTADIDNTIQPSIETFDDPSLSTKSEKIERDISTTLHEHRSEESLEGIVDAAGAPASKADQELSENNSKLDKDMPGEDGVAGSSSEASKARMSSSEQSSDAGDNAQPGLADNDREANDDLSRGHSDLGASDRPTSVDLNDDEMDNDEQLKLSNRLTNSEDELILEPSNYNYAPMRSESPSRYNEGAGLEIVTSQHEDLIDSSVDLADGSSAAIEVPTAAENRVEMSSAAKTHLSDMSPSKYMNPRRISLDSDDDIELDHEKNPIDLAATISPGEVDELLRFNPIPAPPVSGSNRQEEKVGIELVGGENIISFSQHTSNESLGFSELSEKANASAELAQAAAGEIEEVATAPGDTETSGQVHGELHRQLSLTQDERLKQQQQLQSGPLIAGPGPLGTGPESVAEIESQYSEFAARMTAGTTLTAAGDNNNTETSVSGDGQTFTKETLGSDKLLD